MSVAAVAWAFDQILPPNEKVVLLALADCENGQSFACMPGQDYLAGKASMSVRTVQRMLVLLEERGLIKRERRSTTGGQRTSDGYTLALRDNLSGGGANLTTVSGGNTTTVSGTGEPEDRTGSTSPTPSQIDEAFEAAWKAWPNANGKAVARRSWKRLSSAQLDVVIPALVAHANAHRLHTPPQFVPMLSTWLNQERWDDPLPVSRDRGGRNPEPVRPAQFTVPAGHRVVRDEAGHIIGTEPIS